MLNELYKKILAFLFLIGLLGLVYLNTFIWLVESWIYNSYYSHGFLVPIVSLYFLWHKRKDISLTRKDSSTPGLYILGMGLLFHGIGLFWSIRFLSGLSLIAVLAGLILFIYGKEVLKALFFPVSFLVLMIPLPLQDILAPPIQTFSSSASTNLAKLLGLPAANEGLNILLPNATLEVGLPCSGLRSIISLLTIAVIYAYLLEGGRPMKGVIILASIPLALLANVVRIVSVLLVANSYGREAANSFFHDFSSLILFSIALLGLFLVGRCFGCLRFKKIF